MDTCVVGLGYVGIPLVINSRKKGVILDGYDIDNEKIIKLNQNICSIKDYAESFKAIDINEHRFFSEKQSIKKYKNFIVCVPTPINESYEPDHSYVNSFVDELINQEHLPKLIILESTVSPGFTRKYIAERLESHFKKTAGKDFYVCFSPEREDPGNKSFTNLMIPKVLGGFSDDCFEKASALYSKIFNSIMRASSLEAAELTKLHENTFRAVNIAYVNELRDFSSKSNIDFEEVISLAASKPFGFTRFNPGHGVGGHCIPVDPYFLIQKAKLNTGVIASAMSNIREAAVKSSNWVKENIKTGTSLCFIGIGYKQDIDDLRNSPTLDVMNLLKKDYECMFYDNVINNHKEYEFIDKSNLNLFKGEVLISSDRGVELMNELDIKAYYDLRYQKRVFSSSSK